MAAVMRAFKLFLHENRQRVNFFIPENSHPRAGTIDPSSVLTLCCALDAV
jgi:hypothetical protein